MYPFFLTTREIFTDQFLMFLKKKRRRREMLFHRFSSHFFRAFSNTWGKLLFIYRWAPSAETSCIFISPVYFCFFFLKRHSIHIVHKYKLQRLVERNNIPLVNTRLRMILSGTSNTIR